jgi:hypothetical protein
VSVFFIGKEHISTTEEFNNKVIQKLAEQKNRMAEFLFR